MDGLETPYEIEVPIDFIDCSKVEALMANGRDVRNLVVPDFEDILQYLQYLNLDEPIIGLSHLEEVIGTDANDPQPGPRYLCKLCSLEANLPNMINHVIGRKHRQKYLMTHRRDLVTWHNSTIFNQPAKVIRAKSEVVERQDGRGTPRDQGIIRVITPNTRGRHLFSIQMTITEGKKKEERITKGTCLAIVPNRKAEGRSLRGFEDEMPDGRAYEQGASPYRRPHPEQDPLEQFYSEELRRERAHVNEAAATTDRRNYPSRDPHDTFPGGHDDNVDDPIRYAYPPEDGERHHPGEQPRGPRYPPGEGAIDYPYKSDRFGDEIRQRSPAPEQSYAGEDDHRPEAQRRAYPGARARQGDPEPRRNTDQPLDRDRLFEMVGALRNETSGPPRQAAGPSYQMMPEGYRGMSSIPEPFRRFLQRNASSQDIRKRRSRFSDATQEEMEGSKRIQYQPEDYQEKRVENAKDGGKVFDLLNNIEFENGEEADFLNSQLCNLLKEFQAKNAWGSPEEEQGGLPDERFQEHRRPVHLEANVSRRQRYEEVFGGAPPQHRVQHAPHPEDRFQPAAPEFYDGPSASPSYRREQGYRMNMGPKHSSSLDKITSTLLELVARK
ncbi:hypothetical protein NHX12_023153 [Muraenolepis orangiensis]|uniref:Uncharacterized protein n=1 Tax=Muraenolepis orangiensis TaxID=630683 RepID=A0A9Q0ITJ4_9TELE|nr:hypothetical protein NHX12_023153 [Muraenolepis orangiensis]